MNDCDYPYVEFEVMYGYYRRGDMYPVHNFDWIEGTRLDTNGIICASNEMIAAYIDKHLADPDTSEVVYFYYRQI